MEKAKRAKKVVTKQMLIDDINNIDTRIDALIEKKKKLQTKLDDMKKSEILDAIVKSGKTLEEVLELVNS